MPKKLDVTKFGNDEQKKNANSVKYQKYDT